MESNDGFPAAQHSRSLGATPLVTLHDPVATADDLWLRLVEHQPAVAAALALKVRELPEDWSLRVLGVGRPEAALALSPSSPEHRIEIEPYEADWESCPACGEVLDEFCRYHTGHAAGYEALHRPLLDAVTLDADVTVRAVLQRLADADEAAANGERVDTTAQPTGQAQ